MTPERRALLDALLVERFTHLPQRPPTPPEATPDVIERRRRVRLVIDNTRRTA